MTNELCEIYLNEDDDTFIVGYQLYQNAKVLLVNAISENGQIDSVEIINRNRINKVVNDSAYLEFCRTMINENRHVGSFDPFRLADQLPSEWQTLDGILSECQREQRLVSVVTDNEVVSGKIALLSGMQIGLQVVNFESVSFDTPKLINKDDIVVLDFISMQNYYLEQYWQQR